jgi:7-carboxy-7-deazaguanine synthase (Cx14CxxC type)
MYTVKEIFYTLQGEGANAGRAAVFCRFSGCNLWTGREADRATAICDFCDTDFVGVGPDGGKFATAAELASAVASRWPLESRERRFVVCTGGEPLLQLDAEAVAACTTKDSRWRSRQTARWLRPIGIDWICVSPKARATLVLRRGNELKLVFPQPDMEPERFESLDFEHFFLQPMDGPRTAENTKSATQYCLTHPRWRLSLQTHKLLGIR